MERKMNVNELLNTSINVFDVMDLCRNLASCRFGYGFIARSTPKFRAPKTTSAEWFETFGSPMPTIVKVTKVLNARCYDYEKNINKQLEKQGGDTSFKAAAMSGYEWIIYPIIKRTIKTNGLQLCVTYKDCDKTTFEPYYIVGDHMATKSEFEFIKTHLYVAPKSAKQTSLGIKEDDIINVRNYKFENIVAIGKCNELRDVLI